MPRGSETATVSRRSALKGIVVGGLGGVGVSGTVVGKPGGGPPDHAACDAVVPDDHATIQAAVDAAAAGDTICVDEGTYAEQVVIDESLTLRSADGASPTIRPASSPTAFTIAESGPTWEPMVFAYGGEASSDPESDVVDVGGSGTVEVTVRGFTVDGDDEGPGAARKPAVLYRNASGTVAENDVQNVGVGGKETFGILAYGDSTVTIRDNDVSGYERGGIGANGDGGAHPSPSVDVRDNRVTGSTGIGEAWGPNGIQVGFGASGKVRGNVVVDNRYSDEGAVASGILIFESDGVSVRENVVENADVGISVGSGGWFRPSADGNRFVKNDVTEVEYGGYLEVFDVGGGADDDPSVSNNKLVNNRFDGADDPDGQVGISVVVEDLVDDEVEPVAENNKLIRNEIGGFETRIDEEGTETKVAPVEP